MSAPIDEMYTLDAQDPNDPVWETDSNIAGMQSVDDPNDEATSDGDPFQVRTSGGVLDLLNELKDDIEEYVFGDDGSQLPVRRKRLDPITTKEIGADKWRGRTATVPINNALPLVENSNKRRQITIVNNGPNIVYIGSTPGISVGGPNTFPIPVSSATLWAPVVLRTRDDIYAIATVAASVVSTLEEFDMEEC